MEEVKQTIIENYKKLENSIDKIELLLIYLKKIIDTVKDESDLMELDLELQNLMINFSYPIEKELRFVKILNNLLTNLTIKNIDNIEYNDVSNIIERIQILAKKNGKQ
jgi:hypothetical protein